MIPEKLKGTELEKEFLEGVKKQNDYLTGGRYGVMVRFDQSNNNYRPIKSNPDLEGVSTPNGCQWIAECKVCSSASMNLWSRMKDDKNSKQLLKLLERSIYGATSFYLIHWNVRRLKTRTVKQVTYAFPVHPYHPYWEQFLRKEETKINIETCEKFAVEVEWYKPERSVKYRMNAKKAIHNVWLELERFRLGVGFRRDAVKGLMAKPD